VGEIGRKRDMTNNDDDVVVREPEDRDDEPVWGSEEADREAMAQVYYLKAVAYDLFVCGLSPTEHEIRAIDEYEWCVIEGVGVPLRVQSRRRHAGALGGTTGGTSSEGGGGAGGRMSKEEQAGEQETDQVVH
jgi:hypothetical protein